MWSLRVVWLLVTDELCIRSLVCLLEIFVSPTAENIGLDNPSEAARHNRSWTAVPVFSQCRETMATVQVGELGKLDGSCCTSLVGRQSTRDAQGNTPGEHAAASSTAVARGYVASTNALDKSYSLRRWRQTRA